MKKVITLCLLLMTLVSCRDKYVEPIEIVQDSIVIDTVQVDSTQIPEIETIHNSLLIYFESPSLEEFKVNKVFIKNYQKDVIKGNYTNNIYSQYGNSGMFWHGIYNYMEYIGEVNNIHTFDSTCTIIYKFPSRGTLANTRLRCKYIPDYKILSNSNFRFEGEFIQENELIEGVNNEILEIFNSVELQYRYDSTLTNHSIVYPINNKIYTKLEIKDEGGYFLIRMEWNKEQSNGTHIDRGVWVTLTPKSLDENELNFKVHYAYGKLGTNYIGEIQFIKQ